MKKIFTLIVSAVLVTSAFAQHSRGKDNGNDNHYKNEDSRYNDNYSFSSRERDIQIMKINRDYDYKIQAVKQKFFISRFKKSRMIASLEEQRNAEIKMVYAKFNNKHNRYNDKDSRGRW